MSDNALPRIEELERRYADVAEPPPEAEAEYEAALSALPMMLDLSDPKATVSQNGAQPCYLRTGAAPADPSTPC